MHKKWLALFGAPLAGGCVSLSDLSEQGLKEAGPITVMSESDPCPTDTPPGLQKLVDAAAAAPARLAAPVLANIPVASSDLEDGRAIIAHFAQIRSERSDEPAGFLGLDLAQFGDAVPVLDEQGAAKANSALDSTISQSLFGRPALVGLASGEQPEPVVIDRRDMRRFLDDISGATAVHGWTAAMAKSLGAFRRAGGPQALAGNSMSPEQRALALDLLRKYFLADYFRAYFRNGAVLRLEVIDTALREKIAARLGTTIQDPAVREALKADIDRIIAELRAQACTGGANEPCLAFGVIGEQTFVTRAGKSYGFPGITAQLTPFGNDAFSLDTPEWTPVIGDLVRVFMEANGDAIFAVPGAATSTACSRRQLLCGLPAQAKAISQVNEVGDRVEASARSLTSIAVRGGWLFSLNNEALATGIEMFVSVGARKVAEGAAWSRRNGGQCSTLRSGPVHRPITFTVR